MIQILEQLPVKKKKKDILQGMENLVKDDDCIACLFYVL